LKFLFENLKIKRGRYFFITSNLIEKKKKNYKFQQEIITSLIKLK
jgi:hypothetical protein